MMTTIEDGEYRCVLMSLLSEGLVVWMHDLNYY